MRRDSRYAKRVFDLIHKPRIGELPSAHVDADVRTGNRACSFPSSRLVAGFQQYPLSKLHDESDFFGNGNELVRWYQTDAGSLPSHQRFEAGDSARRQGDDRLILQAE